MNIISKLVVASALALSFAAPALAQSPESQTLEERNVYLFMNGKMVHMHAGDATHAMIMKHFKRLKTGTMIYISGGNIYASADTKLPSGKMMSAEIFGRDQYLQ
jgi:hypothetical protein